MTTQEFLQANEKYAASFNKPDGSQFRNLITISCMDARINPYDQLGVKFGEAIHIRNAGDSVKEALRSIIIVQHSLRLDCTIAVFHHTDCGLSKVTTSEMRDLVKTAVRGRDDVVAQVDSMDFHHIIDVEESVKTDVKFLTESPVVLKGTKLTGWVYDVDTGKISQVDEAVAVGI
ncbi:carbonic anhydrase [Mycena filopes]|nr:carbonic anhydrase [Mycena filopes]